MPDQSSTSGPWPYWTLFFCGHFGRATPASRRLNRQTMVGLAIVAGSAVGATVVNPIWSNSELLLVPGALAGMIWIVVAYRRYFRELDELGLRIQLEAIAFAFVVLLCLGFTAGLVAAVTGLRVHPLWIVAGEPLRGLGLVLAARRYR